MIFLRNMARRFASPSVQLGIATLIVVVSSLLTVSVLLRFVPGLRTFAIGASEPFWVLLLSVLALLFAGYTALPAALAYREVKGTGSANGER
jgi:hypothetical protein